MKSKYVYQFDLPIFPDEQPQKWHRTICGIERGDAFDPKFKGYTLWVGGTGGWRHEGTLDSAVDRLRKIVLNRISTEYREIMERKHYLEDMLGEILSEHGLFPFSVEPE